MSIGQRSFGPRCATSIARDRTARNALLQRHKQSVNGRRGQACKDREVGQTVSFVIFGQRFDDRESTVYRLYAAFARLGIAFPLDFCSTGLHRITFLFIAICIHPVAVERARYSILEFALSCIFFEDARSDSCWHFICHVAFCQHGYHRIADTKEKLVDILVYGMPPCPVS